MALARSLTSVGRSYLAGAATPALRITASFFNQHDVAGLAAKTTAIAEENRSISSTSCSSSSSDNTKLSSLRLSVMGLPSLISDRSFFTTSYSASGSSDQASSEAAKATTNGKDANAADSESAPEEEGAPGSIEELKASLDEREKHIAELKEKVENTSDKLLRTLAEMENLRQRTARELDNTQKFAVQKFAKSILDVADTLERAYESVPEPVRQGEAADLTLERSASMLKGVVDGVQMTSNVLLKVLKQHGIEQYNPVNDKFDPNLHSALFEVPDPSKEPGCIAIVTKRGYKMHDRVIRPAEVGVVVKPAE